MQIIPVITIFIIIATIIYVFWRSADKIEVINDKTNQDNIKEVAKPEIDLTFELSITKKPCFLFVDIETNGLPIDKKGDVTDLDNWPSVLQISWLLLDRNYGQIIQCSHYLYQAVPISEEVSNINHITWELLKEKGEPVETIMRDFLGDIKRSACVIAHNIEFDIPIIEAEFYRLGIKNPFRGRKKICTMKKGTNFTQLYKNYGRGYKYPKLIELLKDCYTPYNLNEISSSLHNASIDVIIVAKCFIRLVEMNYIQLDFLQGTLDKEYP